MKVKRRVRVLMAFIGTDFAGFQSQKTGESIQEVVQQTLGKVTQERLTLVGCSRTDAGVHARGFVAHFDTEAKVSLRGLQLGANSLLPKTISILRLDEVPASFHARKDALGKFYRYQIYNAPIRDPFLYAHAWQVDRALDVAAMAVAARDFIGTHDFSSFRAADKAARNPLRVIESFQVYVSAENPSLILCDIHGKSFLKYMVRNMVGTLVEIGKGLRPPTCIPDLFAAKNRTLAGRTAPAQGLTLMSVFYPQVQVGP